MSPISILSLESSPFHGGVASYVHQTAVGLAELGARVIILTRRYPGLAREEADIDRDLEVRWNVKVVRKDVRQHANLPHWLRIIKAHLAAHPGETVLIADNAGQRIASFVPFKNLRARYAVTVHGSEVFNTFDRRYARGFINRALFPLLKARAVRFYDRADGVIFVSRYTQELFFGYFPRRLQRFRVIHNGIDRNLLIDPLALKSKLARARKELRLLTIARVDRRKNHETVIRALAAMPDEVRDQVSYRIVGDGEYATVLKNLVGRLSLDRQVQFTGGVTDEEKLGLLDDSDVFVMPSKMHQGNVEGLGISLLEAGARGLPLIGSHHGGIPEIVSPGQNGFLVDPDSPDDMRAALGSFLSDRSLCPLMGENSRRIVEERFLREKAARETYDFLR
ncbi:MAG: glycosyltransferase family 4 protein [Candidatus Aminicenantes bacterium]|nr:glycosyltransferase family 4 protein [Candidatus Aminicenantes bacterium]